MYQKVLETDMKHGKAFVFLALSHAHHRPFIRTKIRVCVSVLGFIS